MPSEPDVIDDTAAALVAAGLDRAIVRRVLVEVRSRWVGQVYIRATDRSRDEIIRQGLEAGERPETIARKAGVSARTVRRRASTWF